MECRHGLTPFWFMTNMLKIGVSEVGVDRQLSCLQAEPAICGYHGKPHILLPPVSVVPHLLACKDYSDVLHTLITVCNLNCSCGKPSNLQLQTSSLLSLAPSLQSAQHLASNYAGRCKSSQQHC